MLGAYCARRRRLVGPGAGENVVIFIRQGGQDQPERLRKMPNLAGAQPHEGLSPLLGPRFLTRLYRELARAPGCGVWAMLREGRVGGFLIGCVDLKAGFRAVILRAGLLLTALAIPRLLSWGLLRKLPALFLYPVRPP